jgi:hypothetical protein
VQVADGCCQTVNITHSFNLQLPLDTTRVAAASCHSGEAIFVVKQSLRCNLHVHATVCVTLTNLGRVHLRMTSTTHSAVLLKNLPVGICQQAAWQHLLARQELESSAPATAPQPMLQPPTHLTPHGDTHKTNSGLSALQMCTELNEHCWRQKGWTTLEEATVARLMPGDWVQTPPCRAQHLTCTCTIPAGPHIYRLAAYDIFRMNMLSCSTPHCLAVQCCSIQHSDQWLPPQPHSVLSWCSTTCSIMHIQCLRTLSATQS